MTALTSTQETDTNLLTSTDNACEIDQLSREVGDRVLEHFKVLFAKGEITSEHLEMIAKAIEDKDIEALGFTCFKCGHNLSKEIIQEMISEPMVIGYSPKPIFFKKTRERMKKQKQLKHLVKEGYRKQTWHIPCIECKEDNFFEIDSSL